ncbi:mitogen-activated protein kinase kinase kinase 3-like isoform X3 [Montipora capricornis]|uniref:mitogen-activated protein kinase kinase kinase 3-like isoform X3 n=1 Tax=Montipora capricornis TaxID=246305 RepID=UPI0035F1ADAD
MDDDLESGYLSPGSDSTISHGQKQQNTNNFLMPEHKSNTVRIKFEFRGEKRIIPFSRPVILTELLIKVKTAYGQELSMNYVVNEIANAIPILNQSDLDKAIEILDRSQHLTSLRILLSLPNGVTENSCQQKTGMHPPSNPKIGSLFGIASKPFYKRGRPTRYGLGNRSQSTPDEIAYIAGDPPNTPSLSRYSYISYMSSSSIHTTGRNSPPPGFHQDHQIPVQPFHMVRGEGEFIPESQDHVVLPRLQRSTNVWFDPLSHSQVRIVSSPSSDGSWRGSSFSVDSGGEMQSFQNSTRSASNSSLVLAAGMFSSEEDITDSKAHTYPRRRSHTIGSANSEFHDGPFSGNQIYNGTQNSRKPIPASMRTDQQISPASSSSGSSGLLADIDTGSKRRRRESELEFAVQKLKEMSTTTAKVPEVPINWTKGKLLGAGAFGQVYLCHDHDTGSELAVKQVEVGLLNTATQKEVKALEAEIDLLKNLQHERIVLYYGTQQTDLHVYIFMEYMPGGSVHEHIKQHGALNESLTRKYTRQILEGVSYLHTTLIVHRDIKGANILRDLRGNVKLADFGASKRLQTIRSKTGFRSVHGTPYWMAPEVINGEGYGRKADIWSLGCTVVEMLTTKPPWSEFEPMAALFKIATQPTEPELPLDLSEDARDFVQSTLTKNSRQRPSADDLLNFNFVVNSAVTTSL